MTVLILCPACLQRLDVADVDPNQVAASNGALCTCVKCGAKLMLDAKGRVVTVDPRPVKIYAIPDAGVGVVTCSERADGVRFRLRGLFHWFFAKRVTVTNEHVEVKLWWRKMHYVFPLAHVRGVYVIQHLWLDPVSTVWGTYLHLDDTMVPLGGFGKLERAAGHASAINRALLARKPAGDPYRGLLAAGENA
jgi:hypothetical protein